MSDQDVFDEDAGYSVVERDGGYTLYFGRTDSLPGFRVCNLTDWDPNWEIENLAFCMNMGRERILEQADQGGFL